MKVLSFKELKPAKGVPYSRVHVGRLERVGMFPRQIRLGGNAVAWIEDEVDRWLEERAAARDAERPEQSQTAVPDQGAVRETVLALSSQSVASNSGCTKPKQMRKSAEGPPPVVPGASTTPQHPGSGNGE